MTIIIKTHIFTLFFPFKMWVELVTKRIGPWKNGYFPQDFVNSCIFKIFYIIGHTVELAKSTVS